LEAKKMSVKKSSTWKELTRHFPFTILGAATGILLLSIGSLFLSTRTVSERRFFYEDLFHSFHALHLLFSAVASTAVYYRHKPHILSTIVVGFLVTVIPCGFSDILFPFIGGWILGARMSFHLCIVQEPWLVFTFTLAGVFVGIISQRNLQGTSYFSHAGHVLISSFASTFYFVSFGIDAWFPLVSGIFLITTLAVIVPCCASDIVLPVSIAHSHEHPTQKKI
jgi:hypothetical protein